jgi:hypothetical protein
MWIKNHLKVIALRQCRTIVTKWWMPGTLPIDIRDDILVKKVIEKRRRRAGEYSLIGTEQVCCEEVCLIKTRMRARQGYEGLGLSRTINRERWGGWQGLYKVMWRNWDDLTPVNDILRRIRLVNEENTSYTNTSHENHVQLLNKLYDK